MHLNKSKNKLSETVMLFLKGLFMGSADIIPGVSGGTVALITGIYERLIDAIKSVNLKFIPYFFRGFTHRKYFKKAKENLLRIDFKFLLPLMLGIAVAFLLLANILGPLRDNYPTYTSAFFFGLVLSSSFFVYKSSEKTMNLKAVIFIAIGFLVGFLVVGLEAIQTNHSLPVIFSSGAITLCAMILPGISGAFILWFLGQYDFMLGVLRGLISFDFSSLSSALVYIAGGILGLIVFSRVLSFLIKNYRVATLSFLLGLMLGALRKPAELVIHNPENIVITIFSAIIGILIVFLISYYKFSLDRKSIKSS